MVSSPPLVLLLLCSLATAQSDLLVSNLRANGLRPDRYSNADGFVKVSCGPESLGRTNVFYDNPNPSWSTKFTYRRALVNDLLKLVVYDKDVIFNDVLGTCLYLIKQGTFSHTCSLKTGGTLQFSYSLS